MNLVAYFCFGMAVMSFVGIFTMPGGIGTSVVYFCLVALWYQTGVSFLKRKKWAWWVSLVLITLIFIGNAMSVWLAIIEPLINPNIKGVGFGRWLSLSFLLLSGYLISILAKPITREIFRTNA